MIVDKKVTLKMVGLDSNAFSVMGAWKQQARKEKWTKEEIDAVLNEAMSGDYNHLLATIMEHSKDIMDDEEDDEEEDDEEDDEDYDDNGYYGDGEEDYGKEDDD